MTDKVLLVDDQPLILKACERQLGKLFDIQTAEGAQQAMELMNSIGPFAVVISDLRMPGIDGIQLLSWVRERWPDTVRIMLTGNAELKTANGDSGPGDLDCLLSKPTPPEVLIEAIQSGIQQYHRISDCGLRIFFADKPF